MKNFINKKLFNALTKVENIKAIFKRPIKCIGNNLIKSEFIITFKNRLDI